MKPYIHAKRSARKYGGIPEDYLAIHDFFDSTKAFCADMRHRALLHNSWGIFMAEKVFGEILIKPDGTPVRTSYITNSDGKKVQVRDIGEDHVIEDLGRIPEISSVLEHMPMLDRKVKVTTWKPEEVPAVSTTSNEFDFETPRTCLHCNGTRSVLDIVYNSAEDRRTGAPVCYRKRRPCPACASEDLK